MLAALTGLTIQSQAVAQEKPFFPLAWHRFDFSGTGEMQQKLRERMKEDGKMYREAKMNVEVAAQRLVFSRTKFLMEAGQAREFIRHDTLEAYLNDLLRQIVELNNLPVRERMVVVINTNSVNAFNYARGLFMVTVGMLAKVRSESELAFILAHELAHDERKHVQERILRTLEETIATKNENDLKLLFGDKDERFLKELAEYRRLIYGWTSYSRQKELEADSLGFIYFSTAGFKGSAAADVMQLLQTSRDPWFDDKGIFQPLDFARFPFQEFWLKKRLTIYTRKPSTGSIVFEMDSMETHPHIEERIKALGQFVGNENHETESALLDEIINMGRFQSVEASYSKRRYDQCLFHILDLWRGFPSDTYLVSRAGKIFLDLYEARVGNEYETFVPRYSGEYGEQMQLVNTFLHNIQADDVIELAFHFVNANFDTNNPTHYYLLSKIADHTGRENLKTKVEDLYHQKFDKRLSSLRYQSYYGDYEEGVASPYLPHRKKDKPDLD